MRNLLIFVMCSFELLTANPQNEDRYTFCETCITAAHEMERILKDTPEERRQGVIEKLVHGDVCGTAPFHKHGHLAEDKLRSSCQHLLEVYHVEFRTALGRKVPEHLDVALCYEHSTACVGVKRQSFQSKDKAPFKDSDIEALLRDNEANVRTASPVHSGASINFKDEL